MRENFVFVDSIEIDSDFSSINNVELFIDDMCLKLSVSDDLYGNVLIAVSEAVNNAIQHGNQFSKTLKVALMVLIHWLANRSFSFDLNPPSTYTYCWL